MLDEMASVVKPDLPLNGKNQHYIYEKRDYLHIFDR